MVQAKVDGTSENSIQINKDLRTQTKDLKVTHGASLLLVVLLLLLPGSALLASLKDLSLLFSLAETIPRISSS